MWSSWRQRSLMMASDARYRIQVEGGVSHLWPACGVLGQSELRGAQPGSLLLVPDWHPAMERWYEE